MAERLTIARPYAKAVFALASSQQRLPQWSEALALAAAVVGDERVHPLLTNPSVSGEQLVGFINGIAGAQFDDTARNFISTLAANRRLGFLPEIAARYAQLRADAERTVEVTVTSATELSAEQRAHYTSSLQKRLGRTVRLHCVIDPALLGGAIVQADDLVIDGSVRTGLTQLAAAAAG
jgi:F-type H+-transporting ATPase subunit delta